MFCNRCGNQVAEGSAFCMHCGSPLGEPFARDAQQQGRSHQQGQSYRQGQAYQQGQPRHQADPYQQGQAYQAHDPYQPGQGYQAYDPYQQGQGYQAPESYPQGQSWQQPDQRQRMQAYQRASSPKPSQMQAPPFESFPLDPVPYGVIPNELNDIRTDSGKRTEVYVPIRVPEEEAYQRAMDVLSSEGYSPRVYKEELIWKKGTGLLTSMHYIKLIPMQGHMYLQGWVMMGLGDAVLVEQPLSGVIGLVPKRTTKGTIERIQASI